jgi:hypothetical protein
MCSTESYKIWDGFIKDLNQAQKKDIQYSSFVDKNFTETFDDEIGSATETGNKTQEKSPIQMI